MKFSDALKGVRAELSVDIPGTTLRSSGAQVSALCRPLTEMEEEFVLSSALKDAKAMGAESPRRGEELYDAAVMVHTVVASYLDPESPPDARTPFFSSSDELRSNFGSDEIGLMYEMHAAHQSSCSPSVQSLTADQLFDLTKAMANDESGLHFLGLAPGLRARLARFMANLCVTSLEGKLPSGTTSVGTAKS